jgi:hypothetical protein
MHTPYWSELVVAGVTVALHRPLRKEISAVSDHQLHRPPAEISKLGATSDIGANRVEGARTVEDDVVDA